MSAIYLEKYDEKTEGPFTLYLQYAGTWFLMFTNFVPISLLVQLEVVKFLMAYIISWDAQMYDNENDTCARVQASNLNEELGQIEYIFSDKTGTLTQNVMEFKALSLPIFKTFGTK
jgi:phospholipid-transporting ATPase